MTSSAESSVRAGLIMLAPLDTCEAELASWTELSFEQPTDPQSRTLACYQHQFCFKASCLLSVAIIGSLLLFSFLLLLPMMMIIYNG